MFRSKDAVAARVAWRDLYALRDGGEHGERFWVSDRERTVVDAFRLRHRLGEGGR